MTIWSDILLGIVQGFTEYLPVSGSGHLAVLQHLADVPVDGSYYFFHALVHAGTLIALMFVFREDMSQMRRQLTYHRLQRYETRKKRYPKVRLATMILISCIPMLILIPFYSAFSRLSTRTAFVAIMLALTGGLIYVTDHMKEGQTSETNMSVLSALLIGICQCVAVIPGVSRIAAAYGAGIGTGLKRDHALRYALWLSVPASLGIIVMNLILGFKYGIALSEVPGALIGMIFAIISGICALHILRKSIDEEQYGNFAYYCWVAGAVALVLTFIF